jgi:hypothetical protein
MATCKGRSVSDTKKRTFYDTSGLVTNQHYFIPLDCKSKSLPSQELCGSCLDKHEKLNGLTITKDIVIKDKDKVRVWQPRVLHGKIGEPIPPWSQIENGEWYNSMLKKGFRKDVEMVKKKTEEATVVKTKKKSKTQTVASNVVEELKPKMYVDTSVKEEECDIVQVIVKPITIAGKQYYYESKKDKVYTLDYTYVGRYDVKNEVLCTEYPDSDSDPNF